MAKKNCEICGKEIGLLGTVQLGDGSTICKDCMKKAIPYFKARENSLENYKAHIKQLEDGRRLWDAYFENNKKTNSYLGGPVVVNKDTSLMALKTKQGGFLGFGGEVLAVVYRIADLESLELETEKVKDSSGNMVEKHYAVFLFKDVAGLNSFRVSTNKQAFANFDNALKILMQDFGAGYFSRQIENSQNSVNAALSFAKGMKAAMAGDMDTLEKSANEFTEGVEKSKYLDRKGLYDRADEAIKKVLG